MSSAQSSHLNSFSDSIPVHSDVQFSAAAQAQCLCAATRQASRAVSELYDLVLAPLGIKASQYILLRSIDRAGESTQWQLAEQLGVATETLSRRLAAIKVAGWVERRPCRNRRERRYGITPAGKAQIEAALPYWIRAENRLRDSLATQEWNTLVRSMGILAQAAKKAQSARLSNRLPVPQRSSAIAVR